MERFLNRWASQKANQLCKNQNQCNQNDDKQRQYDWQGKQVVLNSAHAFWQIAHRSQGLWRRV